MVAQCHDIALYPRPWLHHERVATSGAGLQRGHAALGVDHHAAHDRIAGGASAAWMWLGPVRDGWLEIASWPTNADRVFSEGARSGGDRRVHRGGTEIAGWQPALRFSVVVALVRIRVCDSGMAMTCF